MAPTTPLRIRSESRMKKTDHLIFHVRPFFCVCFVVGLAGAAQAFVTFSITSRSYGSVAEDCTSAAWNVTARNPRTAAVYVSVITASGDDEQKSSCGGSFATASKIIRTCTFKPTVSGSRAGKGESF
jgi:hypothetical protein